MRSKLALTILSGCAVLALIAAAFALGFAAGDRLGPGDQITGVISPPVEDTAGSPTPDPGQLSEAAGTAEDLEELFVPFWEAWGIVHEDYVEQPVDDELLMRGAISGMLEALGDDHTSYMDPEEHQQSTISLEGEYEGIGAWVDTESEYLTIISPMPGSPAEEAGLEPGDEIIAIDGEDMTGIDGNVVIQHVLGPAGTTVHLTVRREGEGELLQFDVTRESITIPSVEGEILDQNIAYIHLLRFGDESSDELRDMLEELLAENPDGLILDLRWNGGGFLTSAVEITSEFIADGVLLYEEYGDGSRDTHRALRGGVATEIPLVVIINEGTASASEILAGAVQDYERGLLVGTTSFGKGSVQVVTPLSNDHGAVRITVARWLTPDGRQIQGTGLEPDVVVPISDEDLEAETDPQLEEAIDLITDGV